MKSDLRSAIIDVLSESTDDIREWKESKEVRAIKKHLKDAITHVDNFDYQQDTEALREAVAYMNDARKLIEKLDAKYA